jgi:SAM-dependent methyltransferase
MNWPNIYSLPLDQYENWNSYLNNIEKYFSICNGKSVVEIGPMFGTHTHIIKHYEAKSITFVEMDKNAVEHSLPTNHPDCELVVDDIFLYLEQPRPFDVVVCCGVLYHLHSPLYLLELIANRVDPEYIILETFTTPRQDDYPLINVENDNNPGNRHLRPNWKSCDLSIKLNEDTFITVMQNLGYEMIVKDSDIVKPSDPLAPLLFTVFKKI